MSGLSEFDRVVNKMIDSLKYAAERDGVSVESIRELFRDRDLTGLEDRLVYLKETYLR